MLQYHRHPLSKKKKCSLEQIFTESVLAPRICF